MRIREFLSIEQPQLYQVLPWCHFMSRRLEGEKATTEMTGMRLEKTKLDPIVKNRKLME